METEFKEWTPEEVLEMQWQSFEHEVGLTRAMLLGRENNETLLAELKSLYHGKGGDTAKYHKDQAQLNRLIGDAWELPLKF